jgi:PPOX class probable F420-dependent enzyme
MSHRREIVRMTPEGIRAFLESHRRLQVATLNSDGSPHLSVVWYAMHAQDLCFVTYTKTQKIRNLIRDPRITVSVDDGDQYEELRGVVLSAQARLLRGDEALPYLKTIARGQDPSASDAEVEANAGTLGNKRTVVVVRPGRVYSWDHSKLGGLY